MAAKVLVIEDDEGAADLMLAILRKEGLSVDHSADGKDGVEKARVQLPDLVIVDLMLPRMHGFEVIERLREDARFKGMPILVVTAKSYTQDLEGAKDAGATEYMTKPYDIDKFSETVKKLLGGKVSEVGAASRSNPSSPA
ncbi:MAG: hypothetical protein CO113_08380 [Elusimicrobia bacterium CG_4_9_14_3_um_filter_62_55]|nr:MAG: hypothetical protein COR54_10125 [Elusimicrobia bacterium CG22_combo_CG10-13_8_21_14_all_63_91]PJB25494.1 MAG: hypothetical protein CO113_08380 [Elusimicrobia bacterium CG_4_9_14_3_um_filter_62_55]